MTCPAQPTLISPVIGNYLGFTATAEFEIWAAGIGTVLAGATPPLYPPGGSSGVVSLVFGTPEILGCSGSMAWWVDIIPTNSWPYSMETGLRDPTVTCTWALRANATAVINGVTTSSGTITLLTGNCYLVDHLTETAPGFWWPDYSDWIMDTVGTSGEISIQYPTRERLDFEKVSRTEHITDPANYAGDYEATLSHQVWPADMALHPVSVSVNCEDLGFGASETAAPDTYSTFIAGGAVVRHFATPVGLHTNPGPVCSLKALQSYGAAPGMTANVIDNSVGGKYTVSSAGVLGELTDYERIYNESLDINVNMASPWLFDVGIDANDAAGAPLIPTVDAVVNGDTVPIVSGYGVGTVDLKNYEVILRYGGWEWTEGTTATNCQVSGRFDPSTLTNSLTAAHLPPYQWRLPLQVPYSWASWPALKVRRLASFLVDACAGDTDWTATGCTLDDTTNAGKLTATVTAANQTISRAIAAADVCLSSARKLRLKVSCDAGAGTARVYFAKGGTGEKYWDCIIIGTAEQTFTLDLCAPFNASDSESDAHSRYRVEFNQTPGGWGYGVDNGISRTAETELGNDLPAWDATLTIEFSAAGVWTIDTIELVASTAGGKVYVLDLVADRDEYKAGLMPDTSDLWARRGILAVEGRNVLDEALGYAYEDSGGDRIAVPLWLGQIVYWNNLRMLGKGLHWLESGTSYSAPSGSQILAIPGGAQYSTPAQYCNDAQDALFLLPSVQTLADNVILTGKLWADTIKLGCGVNKPLSCVRWFGGLAQGMTAKGSGGLLAAGIEVTATGTTETVKTTSNSDGYYQSRGLRFETYDLTVDALTETLTPAVDAWLRASFCKATPGALDIDIVIDSLTGRGWVAYNDTDGKLFVAPTLDAGKTFGPPVDLLVSDAQHPSLYINPVSDFRELGIYWDSTGPVSYTAVSVDGFANYDIGVTPESAGTYMRAKVHPLLGIMVSAWWVSTSGGRIESARSFDFGATWDTPVVVVACPEGGFGLDIAPTDLNHWCIAYIDAGGAQKTMWSTDNALSWEAAS